MNFHLFLALVTLSCCACASVSAAVSAGTYAEKLGFPTGAKVLILHIDDVGMSWDSNQGAIQAIEDGVANSLSVMMPCPWVPGFVRYMKDKPGIDAGLHLTLTSEWRDYRWGPVAGKTVTPGLVDDQGAMWRSVAQVATHATPDEVETEIRAQLERARRMGFEPTHLDSHMGTLFAKPEFLERYVKVGIQERIPVMLPGGHNTIALKEQEQLRESGVLNQLQAIGRKLWTAGLPVLDDLHTESYDWKYSSSEVARLSDAELQKMATSHYKKAIESLAPGLTMVILHCTAPSEIFHHISDSGMRRKADTLAMIDPEMKRFLKEQKIILTTWRELKARREQLK